MSPRCCVADVTRCRKRFARLGALSGDAEWLTQSVDAAAWFGILHGCPASPAAKWAKYWGDLGADLVAWWEMVGGGYTRLRLDWQGMMDGSTTANVLAWQELMNTYGAESDVVTVMCVLGIVFRDQDHCHEERGTEVSALSWHAQW